MNETAVSSSSSSSSFDSLVWTATKGNLPQGMSLSSEGVLSGSVLPFGSSDVSASRPAPKRPKAAKTDVWL